MASFNKTIITNNGRSLIAKVISGDQIKFTKMVSSSRDYTSSDLSQLTDLSNVEQTIVISSIKKTSDSAVKITGIFSNKDLKTGYKFKTVGLYAIDPDLGEILYSVTTASSVDDMPANTGIGLSSITIGLVTDVSNSNNASLEVSDVATVSALEFNEFKDDVNSHLNEIAKPNFLFNGGFTINQRKKNQYTENYKYTVDRWQLINANKDPSTMSGVLNVGDGYVELTGMGDQQLFIQQPLLEECKWLSGKTITFSIDARIENMKQGSVFFQINYLKEGSTDVNTKIVVDNTQINSLWRRYNVSTTLPENIKKLLVICGSFNDTNTGYDPVNSECKMYFKDAKLEVGSVPTPFVPRSYGEELALCQRYFRVISLSELYGNAYATDGKGHISCTIPTMRIPPTIPSTIRIHYIGLNQVTTTTVTFNRTTTSLISFDTLPSDSVSCLIGQPIISEEQIPADAEIY